jgi:hypothetical protein
MRDIHITQADVVSMFEDSVDDSHDLVEFLGCYFTPSLILEKCDPVAYRMYMQQFANDLMSDGYKIREYTNE